MPTKSKKHSFYFLTQALTLSMLFNIFTNELKENTKSLLVKSADDTKIAGVADNKD